MYTDICSLVVAKPFWQLFIETFPFSLGNLWQRQFYDNELALHC